MNRKAIETITSGSFMLVAILSAACQMQAQDAKAQDVQKPYSAMVALDQYLMPDRNAEITLARTAAPAAISRDAEVLVLERKGFETASKGKNGFVCLVERSWRGPFDDPDFWNPKVRAPICYNPPAARSVLPLGLRRTKMALDGLSRTQMLDSFTAAFNKKELAAPEPGSMTYMMSREAYPDNLAHLMFEVPPIDEAAWGADLPGSPVILGFQGAPEPMTEFIVPVGKWSDGTAAPTDTH